MDSDLSTCRLCNKVRIRIHQGNYPSGQKKFVDENNGLWSGRRCPSCNQTRVKGAMQSLRSSRKDNAELPQQD